VTAALALVRAIHIVSLMIVFGSESLAALVRRRDESSDAALRALIPQACAALALVTAFLWLLIGTAAIAGDWAAVSSSTTIAAVTTGTVFGRVMLARLALLALLMGAMLLRMPLLVRIVLAGAALAAIALTSHAAAAGGPAFLLARAANDAVHLLAAGFWVGGLAMLAPLAIRQRGAPGPLMRPLQLLSQWGIPAVAVLVLAGAFNSYLVLFGGRGAWSPLYLTLLSIKIVLAAVMVSLALANRFGLLPALQRGEPDAEETLLISAVAELAIGVTIVAIVGLLGLLPPQLE